MTTEYVGEFDSLREAYVAKGYVVGSTVEAERKLCAYCGENVRLDEATCGAAWCLIEYWGELNAETGFNVDDLRGG